MQVHLDYTSCRANRPITLFSLVFSCVLFYSLREMCCCYQSGRSGHTVLGGLDRTGLDWTSKTRTCKTWTCNKTRTSIRRTCKTRTQDRLLRTSFFFLFQIFSAFVNRIKLNGEQTFTKTNLRLKILFIYFQAVLFRRFSERNNPCLTFQLQKGFNYMRQLQTI